MTNHETEKLIKKTARGDMAALETLYKEMSKPVYFYALRLLGDPDAAEDVMQDTFISVMRGSASFTERGKGNAWIFTIAKNKCSDILRKKNETLPSDSVPDRADETDRIALADTRITVMEMLKILKDKEREIVMLRLLSGFTLTQISQELGIPKGTAFWLYNNAVKKLRRQFGGVENEEQI